MKKLVWGLALVGWLCYGVYKANDYLANMDPPSELGRMIIDSMEKGDGWNYSDSSRRLVNKNANLEIGHFLLFAFVEHERDLSVEGITLADRYWINKQYSITMQNFKDQENERKDSLLAARKGRARTELMKSLSPKVKP